MSLLGKFLVLILIPALLTLAVYISINYWGSKLTSFFLFGEVIYLLSMTIFVAFKNRSND